MPLTILETYGDALEKMASINLAAPGRRMGVPLVRGRLRIPLFGEPYDVGPQGCLGPDGQAAADAVGLVLCQYILRFPNPAPATGARITFREFEGAGPLMVSFANNTHKTLCSTFGRNPQALQKAAQRLGGVAVDEKNNFDIFLRFQALPHVPIFLQFNACDESFPSTASLLFQQSARSYVNLQALLILATYFTGRMIRVG